MIDFVEAPTYYLDYLVKLGFTRSLIGTDKTDGHMAAIMRETSLSSWYTDKVNVFVKTSRYGGYKCTTSNFIRPPRIFTKKINASEKERLEGELKQYKEEYLRLEGVIQRRRQELERYMQERDEAETKYKDIQARIEHRRHLELKLKSAKSARDRLEHSDGSLEQFREKSKKDVLVRKHSIIIIENTYSNQVMSSQ
jgi:hypothetical protein